MDAETGLITTGTMAIEVSAVLAESRAGLRAFLEEAQRALAEAAMRDPSNAAAQASFEKLTALLVDDQMTVNSDVQAIAARYEARVAAAEALAARMAKPQGELQ